MLHNAHVEELLEALYSTYSDLYKDVNGHRPRHHIDMTVDNLMESIAILAGELEVAMAQQAVDQATAAAKTEVWLVEKMVTGNMSRAEAIEELHRFLGTDGDADYLCWHLGLAYGYFDQAAQAA